MVGGSKGGSKPPKPDIIGSIAVSPSSTKLDKIKNLHIEIQVSSLTLALG